MQNLGQPVLIAPPVATSNVKQRIWLLGIVVLNLIKVKLTDKRVFFLVITLLVVL